MTEVKSLGRVPVGVVGVGSLGQWHTRVYSEIPDAELVGVYDTNAARAAEIAARYHTRVFPSIAALAGAVRAARPEAGRRHAQGPDLLHARFHNLQPLRSVRGELQIRCPDVLTRLQPGLHAEGRLPDGSAQESGGDKMT